ncbi:MAG: WYL domain-containing protein [Pseudomonadota bacterium]|nr:WYL domain-containing protein [Pseudomonadota bacterium]
MDRTERFYLIERLLTQRKTVTRQQFLEALGVSLATLKRDLEYLRNRLHAPILWNPDKHAYEFGAPDGVSPTFELPGLWFNQSEAYALLTMQQLLSDLEPGLLAAHVEPMKARLAILLEEGEVAAAEVNKRIRVLRQAARRVRVGVFETVAAAVLRRRRMKLAYRARGSGERTERVISPQRLVHYRDNWYVDAWCHVRNDLRRFAVDAIEEPELLADKAKAVDLKQIERTLGGGYGIFSGAATAWASLRFTPQRARWVAHELWHPEQRSRSEADGSYVLEVPFSDPRELMMDVLKYGADVEVLGPASLRAEVTAEIGRMAARTTM